MTYKLRVSIMPHLVVLIVYSIITIILTYPLVFHISNALCPDPGDPLFNTWVLAWDVYSLTADPQNFFNSNIFYPFFKNSLALSEHLFANMIVALPVITLSSNPILSYNIIFILSFILSGYGMFLLIRYYINNNYSAFIGGLIFAFCTIRFAHFSHLQLLTVQWLPLCLLYLDKFLHKPDYKNLMILYIFYVLQILSSWYLAFYATISLAVYTLLLVTINRNTYKNSLRFKFVFMILIFIVLVGLVVTPFAIPYLQVSKDYGLVRSPDEISVYSADIADYLLTPPNNLVYGNFVESIQRNRSWAEHSLFPGLFATILALYGLFSLRRFLINGKSRFGVIYVADNVQCIYIVLLLVSFILSLGFPLHFFGHIIDIYMPYRVLYDFIPGFKSMRVPSRFGIVVMLSLSVLAAYGLNRLIDSRFKSKKLVLSFFVAIFILFENLYIPCNLCIVPTQREIPEVYNWLANETGPVSIVEFPIGHLWSTETPIWYNTKYMYYSTFHWKYLVNGYSGFLPTPYLDILWVLQSFPSNESINLLQKMGVKYAIVHINDLNTSDFYRIKEHISYYCSESLHLVYKSNESYVYEIRKNDSDNNCVVLPVRDLYSSETWSGIPSRWMQSDATLAVFSPDNRTANLTLRTLSFYRPRTLEIYVGEETAARVAVPSDGFINVTAPIHLMKGMNTVRLRVPEGCERPCDIKELNNPDTRCLSIAVQNVAVS